MAAQSSRSQRISQRLLYAWEWLITSPVSHSLEDRRYTRLLSALSVGLMSVTIVAGLVTLLTDKAAFVQSPGFVLILLASILLIAVYGVNRAGHYRLAATLVIALFVIAPYVAVIIISSQTDINDPLIDIIAVSILLTGILIRQRRAIIITAVGASIEMVLLPVFIMDTKLAQVLVPLLTVWIATVLTLLYDWHRVQLENDRHWALQTALRRAEKTNQELVKAIESAKEATRLKSETDHQQKGLIAGLRAVIAITDELMADPDTETLYRHAVELARAKLGIERCAIFLEDGTDYMRGTYGTDTLGNTTDEHTLTIPKSEGFLDEFSNLAPQEQRWLVKDSQRSYWDGDHIRAVGRGWVAVSRIHSGNRGIGVLFNDAAISHTPLDATKQEVVMILCSIFGKIIEQKRLDETLKQSEERYRRLFNQIDDTLIIHDLEGYILDVNEAACHQLGYTRDELLRMKTIEIDDPDFARGFAERMHQQLSEGKLSHVQGVHKTRDGHLIDLDVNSTAIIYNGQSAVLAVYRDISEQKRIERDLRELNQLKTEFLSTAAHELRTPLASLVGFSELLLTREIDAARAKHFMQIIHEQSINLRKIIESLLDISRMEAKQTLALTLQPVRLAELVTQTHAYFAEYLPTYHFQIEGASDCPPIIGDRFRLGQVLQNLFSNAIKYSPNGGVIAIRSQVIPGFVQVSVRDQGIGMTAQQQAHLFERFYRADASNTTISGTGLGLAICKLIVELHGGRIWAESEYGVGTTIYFTVPLT